MDYGTLEWSRPCPAQWFVTDHVLELFTEGSAPHCADLANDNVLCAWYALMWELG